MHQIELTLNAAPYVEEWRRKPVDRELQMEEELCAARP
jgi:hypothetical protein